MLERSSPRSAGRFGLVGPGRRAARCCCPSQGGSRWIHRRRSHPGLAPGLALALPLALALALPLALALALPLALALALPLTLTLPLALPWP